MIAKHGEQAAADWLAGLKRNANVYQDEEAVVAAVNRGDVACGHRQLSTTGTASGSSRGRRGCTASLYYFPSSRRRVGRQRLRRSRARLVTPPEAAQKFVDFLVSREGQGLLANGDDFEYPARPGVPANSALPPLDSIPHANLSVAELGDDRAAAKLISSSGFGT